MATYYTTEQIRHATGLTLWSIRMHVKSGWLKGDLLSRKQGYRFTANAARTYLALHFPKIPLEKLDEPLPPKPEWKTIPYTLDNTPLAAHLVSFNPETRQFTTPCKATASQFIEFDPDLHRKCKRCKGHEKKGRK